MSRSPNPIASAWGDHLEQFQWQYFVTLTHRYDRTPEQFHAMFKKQFIRRLARVAQAPVEWFIAVEHDAMTRTHAHALLLSKGRLTAESISKSWRFGLSQVRRYEPGGRASHYVAKTLDRPDASYDISARLHEWPALAA
jgi:hypothetical protein